VDPSATDVAIQGLDGMELGDKKLRVQKASIGITQVAGVEMGVNAMSMLAGTTSTDAEMSRVLQLLNMVTPEELMDNDDYEGNNIRVCASPERLANAETEICEDVRDECSKFGTIVDMKIPRPIGGSRQSAGVGKIFVKYDTQESAKKALQALAGRKFADRTVVTTYFPEVSRSLCLFKFFLNIYMIKRILKPHRRTLKLAHGNVYLGLGGGLGGEWEVEAMSARHAAYYELNGIRAILQLYSTGL
jgi:hypothetical protein